MATQSRRAPAQSSERSPRRGQEQTSERAPRRPQRAGPNLLPVFATLGIVVLAALVVTLLTKKGKDEAQAAGNAAAETAGAGTNPFADIDTNPEQFVRKGKGSDEPPTTDNAPPGMADAPVFLEARKLVEEARPLVEAANAALKAGDNATYSEKANAAREKLEQAMEVTAVWYDEILRQWGSNDAQIKRIDAEVSTWQKLLMKVRKAH